MVNFSNLKATVSINMRITSFAAAASFASSYSTNSGENTRNEMYDKTGKTRVKNYYHPVSRPNEKDREVSKVRDSENTALIISYITMRNPYAWPDDVKMYLSPV